MMTEGEARTKWCPLARVHATYDGGGNRFPMEHDGTASIARCLASTCMAWRWQIKWRDYPNNDKFDRTDKGFCGAFERPE